ncbi:hypothetical protein [Chryseobacterium tongliaoense]|uniref:FEKKY domain-containing protein n=1 Tax=Chryseobacterium tongliaoense TaxID=3240933 RepID=UPI0035128415
MKIFYSLLLILVISCNGTEKNNHTAKAKDVDSTLKWIDYHEGELPPVGYYSAFDSTIKKWNIRYERIDGGCEVIPGKKQQYEQNNKRYFRLLEKKFGKDWRQRFDLEVSTLDHILKNK